MICRSVILALVAVTLAPAVSKAQAWSQNQLNGIIRNNSAAAFSTDQIRRSLINRSVPQYAGSSILGGLSGGQQRRQKPFSSIQRGGPNVSPYMGLISDTPFSSTNTNYFNLVRPQMEQQRQNERLQQQNIMMQRRLNDMAVQAPYSITGAENRAPTGHASVYMNYGGYYSVPQPRGRR